MEAVVEGRADYAVLPIENTTAEAATFFTNDFIT